MSANSWLTAGRRTAVVADDNRRTITGMVVPYGSPGRTSAGVLTVRPGAVRLPADISRVKLLAGHDRDAAIAYGMTTTDTDAGLIMRFRVGPGEAGDLALVDAANRIRDAFSVELDDITLDGDEIVDAELIAVALLSVPAFPDARVAAVAAQRKDPMPTLTAGTATTGPDETTPPTPDTDTELDTDTDTELDDDEDDDDEPAPPPPPVRAARRPAGLTAGRRPRLTFARAVEKLRAQYANRGAAALVAALTDITPAVDTGGGFLQPQWLDEIWTPVAARRDFIESVQHSPLTSGLKVYGWKWEQTPTVGPYAGNKGPIPSSTARTVPAEAPVERFAGGWDVDRIFVDLGAPGFLESFFKAAAADLGNKQEAGIAAVLQAEATPGDIGGAADLWAQLDMAARMLMQQGARLSFAGISSDLWSSYISSTSVQVPWWVLQGNVPSLADATGTAAQFRFFCNADLDPGTVLAGDGQAVTFYESPQVRVEAVNIPNGGVDLALFAYQSTLVNDARGLVNVTGTVA